MTMSKPYMLNDIYICRAFVPLTDCDNDIVLAPLGLTLIYAGTRNSYCNKPY